MPASTSDAWFVFNKWSFCSCDSHPLTEILASGTFCQKHEFGVIFHVRV